MSAPLKVYRLFPNGETISTRSSDQKGRTVYVLATDIGHALALASDEEWADYTAKRPIGILQEYRDGGWPGHIDWMRMACGCYLNGGLPLLRGQGIGAVRSAIAQHTPRCPHGGRP